MNPSVLSRILRPIRRSIANIVIRCVIDEADDSSGIQRLKINTQGFTLEDLERFQNYGFTSVPKADGSEGIVLFPGGNRTEGIVISVDNRKYRLKGLANGEVAIYTDEGDKIHLKRGNAIDFKTKTLNIDAEDAVNIQTKAYNVTASTEAKYTTPNLDASGNFKLGGNSLINGDSTATGKVTATAGVFAAGYNSAAGGPLTMNGDVMVIGELTDSNGTMADIKSKYNGHTHGSNGQAPPNPQM